MANTTLAQTIAPLPPNPTATYYNPDGTLLNPAPAPYTPNGIYSITLTRRFKLTNDRGPWHKRNSTKVPGQQRL